MKLCLILSGTRMSFEDIKNFASFTTIAKPNGKLFLKLRKDKEVWNKVMDIVTLSMFSSSGIVVRGGGVIEMVQYGFARLCDYKHLASDQDIFRKDVI
ncbi:unnamed protein product [Rhizophagus irregularis]|nr:unnamed protein product [Rhizophagus irregularis]